MRIAILSDIHANGEALRAVLEDAVLEAVDDYWCLGDLVGYGPDPVQAVIFLKMMVAPDNWVLGNHDAMLAQLLTDEEWESVNSTPRLALQLNKATLAEDAEAEAFWRAEFVHDRARPRHVTINEIEHTRVHSGQVNPLFRYIYAWQSDFLLPAEFQVLAERRRKSGLPQVQWFGHTHVPTLVRGEMVNGEPELQAQHILSGENYALDSSLLLINPGSVGQPRDLDRRASYCILDTDENTVTFRRVGYDWRRTAQRLSQEEYPEKLVRRLQDAPAVNDTPIAWLEHYKQAALQGAQEQADELLR